MATTSMAFAGRSVFWMVAITLADAMSSAKYAPLFESFSQSSSITYRKLMLEYYAAAEKRGQDASLPADKDGKPVTLSVLKTMTNEEFWKVQVAWFRANEETTAKALLKAHGELGTPIYSIGKMFREGERVVVLAEREFKLKGDLKMPYQVLEYVKEDGKWRLEVPRDLLWQQQEEIIKITNTK